MFDENKVNNFIDNFNYVGLSNGVLILPQDFKRDRKSLK